MSRENTVNLVKTKQTPQSEFPEDVPQPKFLVDDNGHLLRRDPSKSYRNRKEANSMMQSKSFMDAPSTGSYGFSFTPVGYNSAAVRSNVILKGVRPGCRDTAPEAHHTLRKVDTEYTTKTKDFRKTYKDKKYQGYSWDVPKPTHFRE
mmetsp:Transcript_1087/g.3717  ORF Transcript_1087/g.3717 Transcript_1087/m.3717 type:complete len:147 (+) Transcript_1087:2854-3294(+)